MKRGSTLFLRAAIMILGAGVLAVCTVLLPLLWQDVDNEFPSYAYAVYMVFIALYIAAVPYFIGLYKAWKFLSYIDNSKAFSKQSAKAMRAIAICAASISATYIISMPFFYIWGDNDDAPGLIIIGLVLVGAPLVVSVFAALLRRLISEAVDLKSENDLTV